MKKCPGHISSQNKICILRNENEAHFETIIIAF